MTKIEGAADRSRSHASSLVSVTLCIVVSLLANTSNSFAQCRPLLSPVILPSSSDPVCLNTEYCIRWSAVLGAVSYEVGVPRLLGWSWTNVGKRTSSCYTKGTAGTYQYKVRAVSLCGVGAESPIVTVEVGGTVPGKPLLFAPVGAICAGNEYCISWLPVSGATSYQVCGSGTFCVWRNVGNVTSLCYTSANSGIYSYSIRAVNDCGEGESSTITVKVIAPPALVGTPVVTPSYPCAGEQYCISWSSVPGATSYEVGRPSLYINGRPIYAWSDVGNVTQMCYSNSTPGFHSFLIRARNSCGTSSTGTEITVNVGAPQLAGGVSASTRTPSINEPYCITWNPVQGAESYEIQEDGTYWTDVGSATKMCYLKAAAGSHRYTVRGKNHCGVGPVSSMVEVTVKPLFIEGLAYVDCDPLRADAGLVVRLLSYPANTPVQSVATDISGKYRFESLDAGEYRIDLPDFPQCVLYDHISLSASAGGMNIHRACNLSPADPGQYTDVTDPLHSTPSSSALLQNFPNPFNAAAVIPYRLGQGGNVSIDVFDILGRHVVTLVDGPEAAGDHQAVWNGTDARGQAVGSGVYFYRLNAGEFAESRKMVLIK